MLHAMKRNVITYSQCGERSARKAVAMLKLDWLRTHSFHPKISHFHNGATNVRKIGAETEQPTLHNLALLYFGAKIEGIMFGPIVPNTNGPSAC